GDPSTGVPALVDAASAGLDQGIQTFLIGVFAPDEQSDAQANLDAIAAAGGTKSAFVISTNGMVSQELVAALDDVRKSAKGCEFAIPEANGVLPDLEHVTVRVTPPGQPPVTVGRRASL